MLAAMGTYPPPRRRSAARVLARLAWALLWLVLLGLALAWAWQQPHIQRARLAWELSRMPPPVSLPVPVQGVAASRIADTWGAPRGRDRRHEGVDIFAARGTPVTSTTRGIVSAVRDRGLGGRQVWVRGPGNESHYYAHLDAWAPGLAAGDTVEAGTLLGTVGNTGNARTTPPHLHYGIYRGHGAVDPLPRLRAHPVAPEGVERSVVATGLVRAGTAAYGGTTTLQDPATWPHPPSVTASP